jgi:hypothetical protein
MDQAPLETIRLCAGIVPIRSKGSFRSVRQVKSTIRALDYRHTATCGDVCGWNTSKFEFQYVAQTARAGSASVDNPDHKSIALGHDFLQELFGDESVCGRLLPGADDTCAVFIYQALSDRGEGNSRLTLPRIK